METILEKLKIDLANYKLSKKFCDENETSFIEGIIIGIEHSIDLIEESIKTEKETLELLKKSGLKDPDDNAFIETLKSKLKNK